MGTSIWAKLLFISEDNGNIQYSDPFVAFSNAQKAINEKVDINKSVTALHF